MNLPDLFVPTQVDQVSPLNDSLAWFALKVRTFVNCSLRRCYRFPIVTQSIPSDEFSLRKYFRSLFISTQKAQISFPNIANPESIMCILQETQLSSLEFERALVLFFL